MAAAASRARPTLAGVSSNFQTRNYANSELTMMKKVTKARLHHENADADHH